MILLGLSLISLLIGSNVHAKDTVALKLELEVIAPNGKLLQPMRVVIFEEGYIQESPKAINIFQTNSEKFVFKAKGNKEFVSSQVKTPQRNLVLKESDQSFESRKCDLFNSTDRKIEICFHSGDFKKFSSLRDTMKTLGKNNGYVIPAEIINRGFPISLFLEFEGFKTQVKKFEDTTVPKFEWRPEAVEAQFIKLYPKRL